MNCNTLIHERNYQIKCININVCINVSNICSVTTINNCVTGACEGTLACSTCHLIFKPVDYEKIEDKPTDEELDMLDLAYGLTHT